MATAALGQNGFPGGRFSGSMLVGYPAKQAAAEYAVLQSEIRARTLSDSPKA